MKQRGLETLPTEYAQSDDDDVNRHQNRQWSNGSEFFPDLPVTSYQ
jgi:hypothetical protein